MSNKDYTEYKKETNLGELVDGMKELLLEKNKRYGNSALKPNTTFKRVIESGNYSTEVVGIATRLSDKLNRIENSPELRINDISDTIGYFFLLLKALNTTKEDILKLID